jgi:hypothetical protein
MFSKLYLLRDIKISLIISLLAFTACGSMHMHMDDDLELIKKKSFDISEGKNLLVDVPGGDVTVTYWNDESVEVKIFGNENAFDKIEFEINGDSKTVEVIGNKRSSVSSWFSNIQVEVEIKVPAKFNLDINTSGGDIKCGGIEGMLMLNTSGGDIWTDKCSGIINVSTSGGDVILICKNTAIEAETSGGDIELEYSGENMGIDLSTSGGDIDIKLPSDLTASLDLSTSGGDVSCSLTLSNITKSYETSLVGDMNGGGKEIAAHTSGGDITVREK